MDCFDSFWLFGRLIYSLICDHSNFSQLTDCCDARAGCDDHVRGDACVGEDRRISLDHGVSLFEGLVEFHGDYAPAHLLLFLEFVDVVGELEVAEFLVVKDVIVVFHDLDHEVFEL